MNEILPLLDGWDYRFPYFIENVPITTNKYTTIYDSSATYPVGAVIFATVVLNTPNFNMKLSTGDVDLHEINVTGLLYGQAPSGFGVPSGLIANVYPPIAETNINYPISVADPAFTPATGVLFEAGEWFPYQNGIKVEIKVDNPPAMVYESSIGLVNIYDINAYTKSLQKIYAGGK